MQASQYIGSKISLVTKAEIRYEGILYALDLQKATISLAKVKSFGTEDRATEHPNPPKDEVFEFIIFRGADIKSLDVVEPPKSVTGLGSGQPPNDPAIVEVSYYHTGSGGSGGHSAAGKPKRSGNGSNVLNNLLGGQSPSKGGNRRRRRSAAGQGSDAATQAGQSRRNARGKPSRNSGNQSDSSQNAAPNNSGGQKQNGRGRSRGRPMRQNSGDAGFYAQMQQAAPRGYFQPPPYMMSPPGAFRGGFRGGRGGRSFYGRRNQNQQPQGIIEAQQPAKVTFEEPFDFEKSHEELVQTLAKLEIVDKEKAAVKREAMQNGEAAPPSPDGDKENNEAAAEVVFYNKDDFFDNISCEALKKQTPGRNVRIDRRAELKLNTETFGPGAARGGQRRGSGGNYYYRNNYYHGNHNPYFSMMAGGYDPYFMPGNGGYGNYRRGSGGGGGSRGGGGGRGRGFYSGGFYDNF